MPAIQAMRSDAMALRAKEDMQEKIPQFYNSVNQSLGQSIVQGQDAAEQLINARFEAANKIAAELRQKLDGKGGLTELGVGMTMKTISNILSLALTALGKTTTNKILKLVSDFANFLLELLPLREQWDAAVATYGQWTVQAGYTGHGLLFGYDPATVPQPAPGTGPNVHRNYSLLLKRTGGSSPPDNGTTFSSSGVDQADYPNDLVPWDSDSVTAGTQDVKVLVTKDQANYTPPPTLDPTMNSIILYSPSLNEYFMIYTDTMTIRAGDVNVPVPNASLTLTKTTTPPNPPVPGGDSWEATVTESGTNPTLTVSGSDWADANAVNPGGKLNSMGGRGAIKYRDAITPRWTDRRGYAGTTSAGMGGPNGYDTWFDWGSVGSITRVGQT